MHPAHMFIGGALGRLALGGNPREIIVAIFVAHATHPVRLHGSPALPKQQPLQ